MPGESEHIPTLVYLPQDDKDTNLVSAFCLAQGFASLICPQTENLQPTSLHTGSKGEKSGSSSPFLDTINFIVALSSCSDFRRAHFPHEMKLSLDDS